jgi:hypothetical protein
LSSNSSKSHRETPLLLNSSDKSLGASLTARLGRTHQKQAHRDVNAGISNPPDAPPPETRSASALIRFVELTPAGWLHEAHRFKSTTQPTHMNNAHILAASKTDALTKFVLRNPKTGRYYGHGFGFNATLDSAQRLQGGSDLIRTWIVIKALWCSYSPDKGASIEAIQVGN